MNILVVEGEPAILEIVAAYLSRAGHSVVTALDAKEALRIYHDRKKVRFRSVWLNLVSLFIASRLQREPIYEALVVQDGIHLPTAETPNDMVGVRY